MEKGLPHDRFIDQLRGVAVLVVALMHYVGLSRLNYFSLGFVENGYYGVALFFAISGFLITGNILQRYSAIGSVSFRNFYIMRAARILPPLSVAVLFLSLISATTKVNGFAFLPGLSISDAVWHLVTLRFNRYYLDGAMWVIAWSVLWSISIEEAFYLFYPIVAFGLRKEWLLICFMLSIIAYGPLHARQNVNGLFSYFGCFDLMDLGALAAIAAYRLQGRTPAALSLSLKLAGAALALSAYLFLNVREHFAIGPSMVAFGGSLMLFGSQARKHATTLRRPSMVGAIGQISYEIYLFHAAIFSLLINAFPQAINASSYGGLVASLALVCGLCALISRKFSVPLNRAIRSKLLTPTASSPVGFERTTVTMGRTERIAPAESARSAS